MILSLYGNVVKDQWIRINEVNINGNNSFSHKTREIGGIGNCLHAIAKRDDVRVNVATNIDSEVERSESFIPMFCRNTKIESSRLYRDRNIAESIILIHGRKRTSFTNWRHDKGLRKFDPFQKSDWNHFMYADVLEHLKKSGFSEQLRNQRNSMDFCGVLPEDEKEAKHTIQRIGKLMPFMDLVFVSSRDQHLFETKRRRGFLIVHNENGVIVTDKEGNSKTRIVDKKVEGNSIGAGDIFATHTIIEFYNTGDIYEAVDRACDLTREHIEGRI